MVGDGAVGETGTVTLSLLPGGNPAERTLQTG